VSAYAKAKKRARHNLNYWQFGDYLGIGAGAHGKITQPERARILRLWKTRLPKHYLESVSSHKISTNLRGHQNVFGGGSDVLSEASLPLEFLMNCLRLNEGAPSHFFQERTGLSLSELEPQWQLLEAQGLVDASHNMLRTTPLGHRFLNRILNEYIIES